MGKAFWASWLVVLCGALSAHTSAAVSYSTSFEDAAEWVTADNAPVNAQWDERGGHRGRRSLSGQTVESAMAWRSPSLSLPSEPRLICEGWVKAPSGEGWLEVVLSDAEGHTLARLSSLCVRNEPKWTYAAVDTSDTAVATATAATLHIEFWVRGGEASLDDVRLTSASPTPMANSDFEAEVDSKGRIPFWSLEEELDIGESMKKGTLSLEVTEPMAGTKSLAIAASGDWCGASTVAYPIPGWTDAIEFQVEARSDSNGKVECSTVWVDSDQKVVRVDPWPAQSSEIGTTISSGRITPPAEAQSVRPVLAVRRAADSQEARAWFDDVRLIARPETRRAVALVNQIGYDRKAPKRVMVMTNFPPGADTLDARASVLRGQETVLTVPLTCQGRTYGADDADWGWYFWSADISALDVIGTYRMGAELGGLTADSHPFDVDDALLFRKATPLGVDFFFVQRCGFAVPGWHGLCHMDDAKMVDGTHRDLTGGWHSAGDYNKIAYEWGDGGAMFALTKAFRSAPNTLASQDRDGDGIPDILDEARWGAAFMAKLQVDSGGLLNTIHQGPGRAWMKWVAPEQMTDNQAGTEDDPEVQPGEGKSPLAIGGWARLATLLAERGIETDYLTRAVRLWEYASQNSVQDADPLLLISTVELYSVTHDERYLVHARKCVESLLATQTPEGRLPGGNGDSGDIPSAALAHFALELPGEASVKRIRDVLSKHLPHFLSEPDNPFGISRQKRGPDGYFFEPTSALGHNWEFFSRAWGAFSMYRVLGDRSALEYGMNQINFVLGVNPFDLCMMEGAGSVNPPRYHHRYNAIPGRERGAVPGAIPNGFVRDMVGHDRPGFDLSTGGRQAPSYRTSEPWLVHNILAQLAFIELYEALKYS